MNNELSCPNCGKLNRPNAKACRFCGTPLPTGTPTQKLESASAEPQAALPPAPSEMNGFDALPPHALVNNRYEILQVYPHPQMNLYLVADETRDGQQWLLYESPQAEAFQGAELILAKQVQEPHLVRVGQVFTEAPYENAPRGYMTTEFPLTFATDQMRLRETDLLKYGSELGQALQALHSAGLAHNNIQLASIAFRGDEPKLAQPGSIAPLTPETQQQDIYRLALVLHSMAVPSGKTAALLSPPTKDIFQRALVPNAPNAYPTAAAFAEACREGLEAIRRPKTIFLDVGRLTDVGVKRGLNEDAFATVDYARAIQKGGKALGLYVVSDGMGGAAAGELASQIITDRMLQEFNQTIAPTFSDGAQTPADYGALIKAAGEKANRAVYDERTRLRNDMGATLVAALVVGMQAFVINVGDSRAYVIRGSLMKKISKDHSLVQSLIDAKQLTEAEVRTHPQRNIITRSMGEKANTMIDSFTEPLEVGDVLLLCSDGLWEMIQDETVRQTVLGAADPQTAARQLIDLANKNGGDDNITCVLVRIQDTAPVNK